MASPPEHPAFLPLDWLRVALTPGIGPVSFAALLEAFGLPENILGQTEETLKSIPELKPAARKSLLASSEGRLDDAARMEWDLIQQDGIALLPCTDPHFPPSLLNIPARPCLLYVKGTLSPEDRNAVGVVGTRRCDSYGLRMTRKICSDLAGRGITLISGLAHGIDGAAHQAALSVGGRTWAFLPSGFGEIYPPDHRHLAGQILERGALLSEFAYHEKPLKRNFPSRNRLISGASLGTLVIQAPAKSGALITARTALEQNREVFALPGRADEPGSEGPHRLIQDGAKLVTCAEEILEELGPHLSIPTGKQRVSTLVSAPGHNDAPRPIPAPARRVPPSPRSTQTAHTTPKQAPSDLEHDDRRIALRLEAGPVHIDRLAADLDLPVRKVAERLLHLEMKGIILRLPGMCFDLA